MTSPAVPGAINVSSLTGNEIVPIHPKGQGAAQTTTGAIAGLSATGPTGPTGTTGATGPTGPTGATGGGGGGTSITVDISSAQLLALADDPPVIVPAQGAGKGIVCSNIFFEYTQGSQLYDASGGPVALAYDNSDNGYIFAENSNFLNNVSKTVFLTNAKFSSSDNSGIDFAKIDNKRIIIKGPNLTNGPISASTLDVGGAGYAPGDTGEVTVDSGDAIYVVDTVDGGGAVLTYHLSDPGTGFAVQTGAATAITTGGGDGNFTINITSVVTGNGTAKVSLTYVSVEKP